MVGAETGVFLNAASELREHHDGDVVRSSDASHILDESMNGVGCVREQTSMRISLVDVSIEGVARVTDVIQSSWQLGRDQSRSLA